MADDLEGVIREHVLGPAKAADDSGSMDHHQLSDQIAAACLSHSITGPILFYRLLGTSQDTPAFACGELIPVNVPQLEFTTPGGPN